MVVARQSMVDLSFLDGDEEGAAQEPIHPELEVARGWPRGKQTIVEISSFLTIDATAPTSSFPVTALAGPSEAAPSSIVPSSKVGN